ncbi:hypothetical protein ACMBCN_00580 [Candidatus Liberibacter asiaticus]|nr:hypothetical protein [Candidatus Liberibacter asiaticus]
MINTYMPSKGDANPLTKGLTMCLHHLFFFFFFLFFFFSFSLSSYF